MMPEGRFIVAAGPSSTYAPCKLLSLRVSRRKALASATEGHQHMNVPPLDSPQFARFLAVIVQQQLLQILEETHSTLIQSRVPFRLR